MSACSRCGAAQIQRSRALLFVTGALLCGSPLIAWFVPLFWPPALILFLAGAYLIVWATAGRGLWCRQCKSFQS